jgi:hypothetical protein
MPKFKITLDHYHLNTIQAPNYDRALKIAIYLYGLEVSIEEVL